MGSKTSSRRRLVLFFLAVVVFSAWRSLLVLASLHSEEINNELHHPAALFEKNQGFRRSSSKQKTAINATKPHFILHIGPPKTATTTIQCGLENLSAELAQEDSYYYIGKRCPQMASPKMPNKETGIPGHNLMKGLLTANPKTRGFEELKARMEWHLARGNNIIFSIEAMSTHLEDKKEVWDLLLSLFEDWNIRIVIAYRYYFDWLRSMYYQNYIGARYEKWPHQQGKKHADFIGFLEYHLDCKEKNEIGTDGRGFGHHLTETAFKKFAKHFHEIRIFNLHQEGDLVTNFICQMLPTAHKVCKILSEQNQDTINAPVRRASQSFDAVRIAEYAYDKDLIDKNVSKPEIVKKIASHMELAGLATNKEYVTCPSVVLASRFLNASLVFERDILRAQRLHMPEVNFPHDESNLVPLFEETRSTGKFCEIDPDQVLKNDHWREFLSNVSREDEKK